MEVGSKKAFANRESVFKACNDLLARKVYPTQALVRKELGGGSFQTISKYHREWVDEQEREKLHNPSLFALKPKDVQKAIDDLCSEIFIATEQLIVNDRINVLESENEQLRIKLEEAEKKLMDYNEMKGRVEASEAIQSQLLATVENQGRRMEQRDREVEQLKQTLEKIIQEKTQNK